MLLATLHNQTIQKIVISNIIIDQGLFLEEGLFQYCEMKIT